VTKEQFEDRPMSEMVARVAQAMAAAHGLEVDASYRIAARAAVQAMREPTEAMKAAALAEMPESPDDPDTGIAMFDASADVPNIWIAMIDEALK